MESDRGGNGLGSEDERLGEFAALCERSDETGFVRVFLRDNRDPADIRELQAEIEDINGVEDAVFISEEWALKRLKADLAESGGSKGVVGKLPSNPLPDSLTVAVENGREEEVTGEIERLEGADGLIDVVGEPGDLSGFACENTAN